MMMIYIKSKIKIIIYLNDDGNNDKIDNNNSEKYYNNKARSCRCRDSSFVSCRVWS